MDDMTNKELIEKYDDVQSETTRIFKEIFGRYIRKEMSESEYEIVRNISIRNTAHLFDQFISPDISNKEINSAIFEAIEVINDKNR